MPDNINNGDLNIKDFSDSKAKGSDHVMTQSIEGRQDLSKSTVDYYQSRRDGVR